MGARARSVDLGDVARAAGVSRATASRALSGKPNVSERAAKAVLEAAERLQYRVDPIARALRARSSRTVGMVVPMLSNPFFAELVDAIEGELHAHGFELVLAHSHGEVDQERKRIQVLVERRVDGILLIPCEHVDSAAAIEECVVHTPVVQLDRRVDRAVTDFVGVDNRIGMRLVVEHLGRLGVGSAVLVSADDASSVGLARRVAFEEAVAASPITAEPGIYGEFSVAHGRKAARSLLDRPALPDAIVAGSDTIAFGLLSVLAEAGLRVPADVLVSGYDGTELAGIFSPSLTSVTQPVRDIAARAVQLLLGRLDEPEARPRHDELPPLLVPRQSTVAG